MIHPAAGVIVGYCHCGRPPPSRHIAQPRHTLMNRLGVR